MYDYTQFCEQIPKYNNTFMCLQCIRKVYCMLKKKVFIMINILPNDGNDNDINVIWASSPGQMLICTSSHCVNSELILTVCRSFFATIKNLIQLWFVIDVYAVPWGWRSNSALKKPDTDDSIHIVHNLNQRAGNMKIACLTPCWWCVKSLEALFTLTTRMPAKARRFFTRSARVLATRAINYKQEKGN